MGEEGGDKGFKLYADDLIHGNTQYSDRMVWLPLYRDRISNCTSLFVPAGTEPNQTQDIHIC